MNIAIIPIIIGIVTALLYLLYNTLGGNVNMETGSIIALVVAVLGVAGGIWAQVVQFRRDSKRIDDVKADVGKVKSDTSEMIPVLKHTDDNTKKIRDHVVENIYPVVSSMQDTAKQSASGINRLVEELNYQSRIKRDVSEALVTPDFLVNGIEKLYEENANLRIKNRELLQLLMQEQTHIRVLQHKIDEIHQDSRHQNTQTEPESTHGQERGFGYSR